MEKYNWHTDEIPVIEAHSIKKHEVLREYLKQYILIVGGKPFQRKNLTLTIVDGFAGGGLYQTTGGDPHFGSPLICLKTLEEAECQLSQTKPFKLDSRFIFVEKNKSIVDFLKTLLIKEGYKSRLDNNLFLLNASFEDKLDEIIDYIANHTGRARRCIFVLDQYGYSDVGLQRLSRIFTQLPKAEVILTFAVDYLIDYLNDSQKSEKLIENLGLNFDLSDWNNDKSQRHWRQVVQRKLYKEVIDEVGSAHYTNFFIKSRESNKSYWLLHLSTHMRARDEMQTLHWNLSNSFLHEGKAGLFMLGYDPDNDIALHGQPFLFGNRDRELNQKFLLNEIPKVIPREGIHTCIFFQKHCNNTTATFDMIKQSIGTLYSHHELEVYTKGGREKKRGVAIQADDFIRPRRQLIIPFT